MVCPPVVSEESSLCAVFLAFMELECIGAGLTNGSGGRGAAGNKDEGPIIDSRRARACAAVPAANYAWFILC